MSSMTTDGVMGYDGNKWYKLCSDGYENSESQIMGWWVMMAINDTSYVQTVMKLRVTNHGVLGYDGYKWYKLCSDGNETHESQIMGWWVMMATNDTSYVEMVMKLKSHNHEPSSVEIKSHNHEPSSVEINFCHHKKCSQGS